MQNKDLVKIIGIAVAVVIALFLGWKGIRIGKCYSDCGAHYSEGLASISREETSYREARSRDCGAHPNYIHCMYPKDFNSSRASFEKGRSECRSRCVDAVFK